MAGITGSHWQDGYQMWWKFFKGRPLVKATVRTTPHGDLTIAVGLGGKEFHNVIPITPFIYNWFKVTLRVATAAHIDCSEDVTVAGKVYAPLVEAIADVRGEGEDEGRGSFIPLGLYSVAFSLIPSRVGIFTAHVKSMP